MDNYQVQQAMNSMMQMMTLTMTMGMVRTPMLMFQKASGGLATQEAPKKKPTTRELEELVSSMATRIDTLEDELKGLRAPEAPKRALFGGKKVAMPIMDEKTEKVYHSKSSVGKALAGEVGTVPGDKFAWYRLIAKFPVRFREASDVEIAKAKAEGTYLQLE